MNVEPVRPPLRLVEARGLREDRELGLYSSAEDVARYRDQMRSLIARRDALKSKPIRAAGWTYEETDQTYDEVWGSADGPEARRKLLVDAGVRFVKNMMGLVQG